MIKVMNLIGIKSRRASEKKINIDTKNKVLNLYAKLLDKENKSILRENLKDIKFAKNKGIKENLINRLQIDKVKLKNIKESVIRISKLKDPVNVTLKKWSRPNGLNIKKLSLVFKPFSISETFSFISVLLLEYFIEPKGLISIINILI